jgi:hypothetical protein
MTAIRIVYGLGVGYLISQCLTGIIVLIFSTCWDDYSYYYSSSGISAACRIAPFWILYFCGLALAIGALLLRHRLRVLTLPVLVGGLLLLISPSGLSTWSLIGLIGSLTYQYGGTDYMWGPGPVWQVIAIAVALAVLAAVGYRTLAASGEYEGAVTTDATEGGAGMSAIRIVYGLGIGVLIAMVVIIGIISFYEPPYSYYGYGSSTGYAVSVLLIAGILGLVLTVLGLMLPSRINPIKLGMLSGGFIILLFAIIYPSLFGLGLAGAFGASFVALIVLVLAGFFGLPSRRE